MKKYSRKFDKLINIFATLRSKIKTDVHRIYGTDAWISCGIFVFGSGRSKKSG